MTPITVLTGTNNSGKSSFFKMMNLFSNKKGKFGLMFYQNFLEPLKKTL